MTWAEQRRGWLFLNSTPETRTRLVPLISLWLDMLVLRLMGRKRPDLPRVWFVLDHGLMPDERLVTWVLEMASTGTAATASASASAPR